MHGDNDSGKITLTRKQTSEIRATDSTGRARTVQVEVRKKRTFVKRDELAAEAVTAPAEGVQPVEQMLHEEPAPLEAAVEAVVEPGVELVPEPVAEVPAVAEAIEPPAPAAEPEPVTASEPEAEPAAVAEGRACCRRERAGDQVDHHAGASEAGFDQ